MHRVLSQFSLCASQKIIPRPRPIYCRPPPPHPLKQELRLCLLSFSYGKTERMYSLTQNSHLRKLISQIIIFAKITIFCVISLKKFFFHGDIEGSNPPANSEQNNSLGAILAIIPCQRVPETPKFRGPFFLRRKHRSVQKGWDPASVAT